MLKDNPDADVQPIIVMDRENNAASTKVQDLPLENPGGNYMHQWFDEVKDWQETPDMEQVKTAFESNDYASLPGQLKLAEELDYPYTLQCFIVPQQDGSKTLLKHIILEPGERVQLPVARETCHGILQKVNYGRQFKLGSKALQLMLERLPGFHVRYYQMVLSTSTKINDEESQRKGFEFIKKWGPKTNLDNKAIEFAEIHTKQKGCPIFGWAPGLLAPAPASGHCDCDEKPWQQRAIVRASVWKCCQLGCSSKDSFGHR